MAEPVLLTGANRPATLGLRLTTQNVTVTNIGFRAQSPPIAVRPPAQPKRNGAVVRGQQVFIAVVDQSSWATASFRSSGPLACRVPQVEVWQLHLADLARWPPHHTTPQPYIADRPENSTTSVDANRRVRENAGDDRSKGNSQRWVALDVA